MRSLYFFIALLCYSSFYGQKIKTMNKGSVNAKNYSVTIPYKDIRGLVIVEGIINGKTYNFMLDTGALTAISPRLYKELNLPSETNLDVDDSSDIRENMKVVTMPAIQLNGLAFNDIPAVVANDSPLFECLGIDGFLGSNLMRNSVVKFSYKTKTVTFTDKSKTLGINKKQAVGLFKDKMQSNPHLWIDLNNGDIKGREVLLFDTGMTGFYEVSLNSYDTVFKKINIFNILNEAKGATSIGINGVAESNRQYRLLLPRLNFAGGVFNNIMVNTTNDNRSRIGAELLKYGDVIIDYPSAKLYFEAYTSGETDLSEKYWPVQPVIKDGKFVIGIVWDSALNNQIKEGDEILKFGEINYESLSICDAFTTVLRPKNETAVLVLKDADTGDIKEIEITKN